MSSTMTVPQIKIEAGMESLTINEWVPLGDSVAVASDVKVEPEPYTNDAKFAFDGTPIKQEPDYEDVWIKVEPSDEDDFKMADIRAYRRRLIIHPPKKPLSRIITDRLAELKGAKRQRRVRLVIHHSPGRDDFSLGLKMRRRLAELERKKLGVPKLETLGRIITRARAMLAMGRRLEQMTLQEPVPQKKILPGEAPTRSEHAAANQERLRQERVVMQSGLPMVRLP